MTDHVRSMRTRLTCLLIALGIVVGETACVPSPCGIWGSRDDHSQITSASDPSRRIPRWTDDGQRVMFDFPGTGVDPITEDYSRDSIRIVDSHGLELKEWTPADAPSWSSGFHDSDYAPDVMGDKVVFTTLRHACSGSKGYEIATANLDGSGYRRLTDADGADLLPTWSPDGSRIAFVSNRIVHDGSSMTSQKRRDNFNVYVMDADGSNVRSLAPGVFLRSNRSLAGNPYEISPPGLPVWSSNGQLAFRSGEGSLYTGIEGSLYTVHPEKSGAASLGLTSADPAWSPDGEWIAWAHSEPGSFHEGTYYGATIYVARTDGSETRRVFQMSSPATYEPHVLSLSWTPDGQSLRFVFAPRHFMYGLYQLSLGESNPQLIAEVPRGATIVWSPDGSRALVSKLTTFSYKEGEELLYTIAADGSDKRVLVKYTYYGPVAANGE